MFPLVFERSIGAWRFEEALTFVVIRVAAEITCATPDLGGPIGNTKLGSDLFEGQHSLFSESLMSVLQPVLAAKAVHHVRIDRLLLARSVPAFRENRGD